MALKDWWRPRRRTNSNPPIVGVAVEVEAVRWALWNRPNPHIEALEIGATNPEALQFVLISSSRRVKVTLSAQQARWLAGALVHWADVSENIPVH
jgi:hypothetical protein